MTTATKTMTAFKLEMLPDELIEHIVTFLVPNPDPDWLHAGPYRKRLLASSPMQGEAQKGRDALRALCLVNKRFYTVAQPLLGSHVFPVDWDSRSAAYYKHVAQLLSLEKHLDEPVGGHLSRLQTQVSWLALFAARLPSPTSHPSPVVTGLEHLRGLDIILIGASDGLLNHIEAMLALLPQLEAASFVGGPVQGAWQINLYTALAKLPKLRHLRLSSFTTLGARSELPSQEFRSLALDRLESLHISISSPQGDPVTLSFIQRVAMPRLKCLATNVFYDEGDPVLAHLPERTRASVIRLIVIATGTGTRTSAELAQRFPDLQVLIVENTTLGSRIESRRQAGEGAELWGVVEHGTT